jgi:hypothetical protein
METRIAEIARWLYRLSTFAPNAAPPADGTAHSSIQGVKAVTGPGGRK